MSTVSLDLAWKHIAALDDGGDCDEYDDGYSDGLKAALEVIEGLGGMRPEARAAIAKEIGRASCRERVQSSAVVKSLSEQ